MSVEGSVRKLRISIHTFALLGPQRMPDQPSTREFAPDLIASEPAWPIKPSQTPVLRDVQPEQVKTQNSNKSPAHTVHRITGCQFIFEQKILKPDPN